VELTSDDADVANNNILTPRLYPANGEIIKPI
jgi:hypothetical protein